MFFILSRVASHWPVVEVNVRSAMICARIELLYQVRTPDFAQFTLYSGSFLGLIPKEELALSQLLTWRFSTEHRFQSVRVIARIPRLCAYGHWRRRKVLHLFKVEVQLSGNDCEFCHILFMAARV